LESTVEDVLMGVKLATLGRFAVGDAFEGDALRFRAIFRSRCCLSDGKEEREEREEYRLPYMKSIRGSVVEDLGGCEDEGGLKMEGSVPYEPLGSSAVQQDAEGQSCDNDHSSWL
jgi:hypothetical protein